MCPMCTILQSSESLCACYRPLLPKLLWREGLQPREGSTVRAKILPKKHKTFYFPASSELFLARYVVFWVVSPSLVVGTEGSAAYTAMPGGLVDSWHRCSRSHRDSDASNSWGHISAPSRPLVLVLGFPSFRCSLTFRSRYWLLSSSSMVGYIGDTAQFHQNFFL